MRKYLAICISLWAHNLWAQEDTSMVPLPMEEYSIYQYDSLLQTDILSYHYGLWDFDGDGIQDSVVFTSNGGAHAYYALRLWTSDKQYWVDFPDIQIDMPYPSEMKVLPPADSYYPQFMITDIDEDGRPEMYFNLSNSFSATTKELEGTGHILLIYNDCDWILKPLPMHKMN